MDKMDLQRIARGAKAEEVYDSISKEESIKNTKDVTEVLLSVSDSLEKNDVEGARVLLGIEGEDNQEPEAESEKGEGETVQLSEDEKVELEAAKETARKHKDCLSNVEAHCESLQLKLSKAEDKLSDTLKSDLESRLDNITQFINKVKGE